MREEKSFSTELAEDTEYPEKTKETKASGQRTLSQSDEDNTEKVMMQKRTIMLRGHLRNRYRGVYAFERLARRRVGLALVFVNRNSSSVCDIKSQLRYWASEEAS